ncbi:efflux transporter outer membrane subunit [Pseudogulbenkiania ferrooxidans]|uniref:RND efflux system, outer membrane lipoprotein, NodT family n=1 Tax=Pseudogulbenkiania ferrooxidans 2002 TaxID=279714 RepID=B9YZ51_9NEIS|nr:efflux transporter outer membrane subunit [Pseudogulbenkiania ferrooxidans]EEG10404.1 RND efflux system, outer membrane lipoprotein, NodT family [Pseudogulbenkiania ferrooxidans 2002]
MKPLLAAVLLGLALSGCAALNDTPYSTPRLKLPSAWEHAQAGSAATASSANLERWWQRFGDAELDTLIELMLERNNDLAAATLKVRRARLAADLADDALSPSLAASADSSASHSLKHGGTTQSHAVSASVSYELDLWGKLAHQRDAKVWEAKATEQDKQSTRLSLIGTTATLYWKIGYLKQRLALSQDSIAYAERTRQLVRAQKAAGAASQLDLLNAEQTLASQQASHTELMQQLAEARNALSLLFDDPPGSRFQELERLPEHALPAIAAGVPAQLLARRPDLAAAELRLRATLASGDATRASYYPDISLTGSLGSSSTTLSQALSNPVATLGAGLTLPFLQWRAMQLNSKVSEAEYQQAVVEFRQTLYQALADVENALSARRQYQAQGEKLEASLSAASQAERLYEVRYRAGAAALKDWLEAQETRRQADIALLQNRYNQLANQVTVYQALGGGVAGKDG